MRRDGGSFGLVILLVVMVIVLLLATRAWRSVTPQAGAIAKPAAAVDEETAGKPTGPPPEPVRRSDMPDLRQVKQRTAAHSADVRSTLEAAE